MSLRWLRVVLLAAQVVLIVVPSCSWARAQEETDHQRSTLEGAAGRALSGAKDRARRVAPPAYASSLLAAQSVTSVEAGSPQMRFAAAQVAALQAASLQLASAHSDAISRLQQLELRGVVVQHSISVVEQAVAEVGMQLQAQAATSQQQGQMLAHLHHRHGQGGQAVASDARELLAASVSGIGRQLVGSVLPEKVAEQAQRVEAASRALTAIDAYGTSVDMDQVNVASALRTEAGSVGEVDVGSQRTATRRSVAGAATRRGISQLQEQIAATKVMQKRGQTLAEQVDADLRQLSQTPLTRHGVRDEIASLGKLVNEHNSRIVGVHGEERRALEKQETLLRAQAVGVETMRALTLHATQYSADVQNLQSGAKIVGYEQSATEAHAQAVGSAARVVSGEAFGLRDAQETIEGTMRAHRSPMRRLELEAGLLANMHSKQKVLLEQLAGGISQSLTGTARLQAILSSAREQALRVDFQAAAMLQHARTLERSSPDGGMQRSVVEQLRRLAQLGGGTASEQKRFRREMADQLGIEQAQSRLSSALATKAAQRQVSLEAHTGKVGRVMVQEAFLVRDAQSVAGVVGRNGGQLSQLVSSGTEREEQYNVFSNVMAKVAMQAAMQASNNTSFWLASAVDARAIAQVQGRRVGNIVHRILLQQLAANTAKSLLQEYEQATTTVALQLKGLEAAAARVANTVGHHTARATAALQSTAITARESRSIADGQIQTKVKLLDLAGPQHHRVPPATDSSVYSPAAWSGSVPLAARLHSQHQLLTEEARAQDHIAHEAAVLGSAASSANARIEELASLSVRGFERTQYLQGRVLAARDKIQAHSRWDVSHKDRGSGFHRANAFIAAHRKDMDTQFGLKRELAVVDGAVDELRHRVFDRNSSVASADLENVSKRVGKDQQQAARLQAGLLVAVSGSKTACRQHKVLMLQLALRGTNVSLATHGMHELVERLNDALSSLGRLHVSESKRAELVEAQQVATLHELLAMAGGTSLATTPLPRLDLKPNMSVETALQTREQSTYDRELGGTSAVLATMQRKAPAGKLQEQLQLMGASSQQFPQLREELVGRGRSHNVGIVVLGISGGALALLIACMLHKYAQRLHLRSTPYEQLAQRK